MTDNRNKRRHNSWGLYWLHETGRTGWLYIDCMQSEHEGTWSPDLTYSAYHNVLQSLYDVIARRDWTMLVTIFPYKGRLKRAAYMRCETATQAMQTYTHINLLRVTGMQ